jgi:hypothetical protein
MALSEDFGVHIGTHLDSLKSLRSGVPEGLPAQLGEVSAILLDYDVAVEKIDEDRHLSAEGKAAKVKTAHDEATAAVEKWRTGKTTGIDAQTASQRAALLAQADKATPVPSDLQVANMVQRLRDFDPLEVEILYADGTDAERKIIEAAANAIGRQPIRRGDSLTWEPIISTERMTAVIAERVERANPDGAAALRDLQRIRNTYDTLAGSAKGLLNDAFPTHYESAPVA